MASSPSPSMIIHTCSAFAATATPSVSCASSTIFTPCLILFVKENLKKKNTYDTACQIEGRNFGIKRLIVNVQQSLAAERLPIQGHVNCQMFVFCYSSNNFPTKLWCGGKEGELFYPFRLFQ
ncbi:hypothetical protein J6590_061023 [Homalodisca vitripennis]|nr:hypothetical protein J6590_061023 [Homalodisca vitripennis]